ncbi:uncharacterized protein M8220_012130 isoform 3-T7 [Acridotheres tristis]
MCADAMQLPCNQQKCVGKSPISDFTRKPHSRQNINRALLDNERATAKLLLNRMKSELEKEKWHQLKWQGRVKDWKLMQKKCVVQSFRECMASEEIQNPPTLNMEMGKLIKEQMVLSEERLKVLQYMGIPGSFPTLIAPCCLQHVPNLMETNGAELWRTERKVSMTLLDTNICTAEDAEVVHSNVLQVTEKLKCRFEEVEHVDIEDAMLDTRRKIPGSLLSCYISSYSFISPSSSLERTCSLECFSLE